MSDPILSVQDLTKRFGPNAPSVVHNVSFDVDDGEIFSILGPSGCGKTTTLRCIAGFERATAGAIALRGQELSGPGTHVSPEARTVGIVFQNYALFPHLTVRENVAFGLNGAARAERNDRAREALEMVGLGGFEDRQPQHLSGGQQQRVALARALAPEPDLILLDEPFSNLDALLRQETRQEVRELLKSKGMSAVLVTHNQEEALSFADRLAVMRGGQIDQVGTPEDVYYQPRTLFVAQFLGRTNLLLSQATGAAASTPLGEVTLNDEAEGTVLVSMRPEHLALVPPENADGPVGTVMGRAFKGHDITYRVCCNGSEYLVHADNRTLHEPGDTVAIRPLEPAVVLESRSTPAEVPSGATPEPE
ncbi:MAG: iron ABC transporter ATP-binding protein [Bacteroidetes bacterium QS_1_63_11]|nr:MAG: iron ABC transporter ATP-binding protein [Bacteroidetes bacterium QS_1_63_11]